MRRLDDASEELTLLVPTDAAIDAMVKKPWRALHNSDLAAAVDQQDQIDRQIEAFVGAHIVAQYPMHKLRDTETLSGVMIQWDGKDKIIVDGQKVDVVSKREAGNGAVWVIDGILVQ